MADNEQLGRLLLQQHEAKRPIAAICAAPLVLGRLGILDGQTATCYPGFEPELKGATVLAEGVVVSNHITTGRGPAYALDFALQLVETHCGKPVAEAIRNGMLANK